MRKSHFKPSTSWFLALLFLPVPLLLLSCLNGSEKDIVVLSFDLDSTQLGNTDSLRFEVYNGKAPDSGDTAKPVQVFSVKTPKGVSTVDVRLSEAVGADFSVLVTGFDSAGTVVVSRKPFEFKGLTRTVPAGVPLKGIQGKALSGLVGDTLEADLTFEPADATVKTFQLRSLDSAIARVSGSKVVGKAEGKTRVEVTATDGGLRDTFEVTVSTVAIPVLAVTGRTLRGLLQDTLAADLVWNPPDATEKGFTLRSLDSALVRVPAGKIVPVKLGKAAVEVTAKDGGSRDTFEVSIEKPAFAADVRPITALKCAPCHVPGTNLNFQDSLTLIMYGAKAMDRLEKPVGDADRMPVITAPNGDLTPREMAVVLEWLNARVVRLKGVAVADDSLKLGEMKEPSITWDPPDATNKTFTLASLDTTVVAVIGDQLVGRAFGKALVQLKVVEGERLITFSVQVVPTRVDSIAISDTTAAIGDTLTPEIRFHPSDATNQAYSLTKLNPASTVAIVLPGKRIVANALGKDTLVAISSDGAKVDHFTVTVGPVLPAALAGQDTNGTVGGPLVTPRLTWSPANTTTKTYRLAIAPADTAVAAVRGGGLQLQGKTLGKVNVTAVSLVDTTVKGVFKFTVGPVSVIGLSVAATTSFPGSTVDPVITWNPANATTKTYTLVSLDTAKVKIVANRASIRKLGKAAVTVISVDGSKTATWNLDIIRTPFTPTIRPIIFSRCGACHNASHAPTNWLDSATAVANRAEMLRRTGLPMSHVDHMPPATSTQPTPLELATLRNWLSQE